MLLMENTPELTVSNPNTATKRFQTLIGAAALIGVAAWGANTITDHIEDTVDQGFANIGDATYDNLVK